MFSIRNRKQCWIYTYSNSLSALTTPNTYSVAINQKRCQIKAAKGRKRRKSIVAQILSLILLTLIRSFASYGNNKMKPAMTELVDKKWNKQYEKLVEFKRKHGNCLVTSRYQEDMSLGAWVSKQRNVHISNKLRLDRKGLLDEIGFVWGRVDKSFSDEFESRWKTQYEKLVDFKRKHGNCLVPRSYQKDLSFGKWVNTQRQLHVNNTIRTGRKDALDQLGFAWKAPRGAANNKNNNKNWHQQYEKLVDFKRKHGNCIVPRSYEEDVAFGNWVHNQRQRHNRNTIRQDQKELLDEIGLVWTSVVNCSQKWNKQYEKLVEFKQKNGHCLVPYKYQEDASFGNWVWWQRGRHANNKILPYRKKLLDEIGFVWKAGTVVARSSTTNDSDSETSTSSVGLPNETPGQGHVRNRCPNPNIKQTRACLAESRQVAASRDEEDSKPSLVTSSALIASYPDQEVVQEEATHDIIPSGWTRLKLEPDC